MLREEQESDSSLRAQHGARWSPERLKAAVTSRIRDSRVTLLSMTDEVAPEGIDMSL